MNKALFDKVKGLCKDYGLSEKYLKDTTEAMGGHISDDSTDTEEIEKVANQVAAIAKHSQAEATRWAAKKDARKRDKKEGQEGEADDDGGVDDDDDDSKQRRQSKRPKSDDPVEARIKALEERLAAAEAEKSKSARMAEIEAALEKHKIPKSFRKRFAKSIDDDEDIEEVVSEYKQELITNGLDKDDLDGAKEASEKDTDSAAESLLKTISTEKK